MEHLTKQQIVLLTLLVGFVTSIASSIVTVSLLDQSTPTVTQTINRVVERTIEKATPSTPIKETIIVKEDQATVDAIAKVQKGVVHIKYNSQQVAAGLIITASGKISALTDVVYDTGLVGVLDGGNTVSLRFVSRDPLTGITIFQAEQGTDEVSRRIYTPVTFANSDGAKLGQSVVIVDSSESPTVATSIISSLSKTSIKTQYTSFDSGAILVNLLGEVLGIKGNSDNGFIPSNIIKTYATP